MIKKWISATELCEKWKVEDYELFEIVIGSIEWSSDPQKIENRPQCVAELYLDLTSVPCEAPLKRKRSVHQGPKYRCHYTPGMPLIRPKREEQSEIMDSLIKTFNLVNESVVGVGLQAYLKTTHEPIDQVSYLHLEPEPQDDKKYHYLKDVLFLREQAQGYGKKIGMPPIDPNSYEDKNAEQAALSGKERQELGRLKHEKEKWDASIHASVAVAVYCIERSSENPENRPTRKEIADFLFKFKLPDTTTNKIIKAIPTKYRHSGGRPKNPLKDNQD